MPPVGFEPTIWAGERPQTHALDRAATGTSHIFKSGSKIKVVFAMSPGRVVYCDDGAEVRAASSLEVNWFME